MLDLFIIVADVLLVAGLVVLAIIMGW